MVDNNMQHTDEITGGRVTSVDEGSLAHTMGIREDDLIQTVNGQPVEDVIDVQFYAAEYIVRITGQRDGTPITFKAERSEMQPLGLNFEHPTFDIDIRRCNNLCEFCFVLQMAPRFRRTLYIKDDDYRYSFLFGHYVTLTNLSEHDEWRIVEQGLSPLYVSVHATDLDLRRKYLRNAEAPDIIPQMERFIEEGIDFHTQIVLTPGYNDGPYLEKTVEDLASLYPGVLSVTVVPVGLTQHHKYGMRPYTPDEAAAVLDQLTEWQAQFREAIGMAFVYPTDEWFLITGREFPDLAYYDGLNLHENGLGMVRNFKDEWAGSRDEILPQSKITKVTLATGTLFAPVLTEHAAEFTAESGIQTEVRVITNTQLGETITCAGLLMGGDIIEQLKPHADTLGDVVVLPRVAFDHPNGVALDDVSPLDIAKALDTPVALADLMGDVVDVVNGKPALYFHPQQGSLITPDSILRDGGWAVEKYL